MTRGDVDKHVRQHAQNVVKNAVAHCWCYGCGKPNPEPYMVRRNVWLLAVPEYTKLKMALAEQYGRFNKGPDRTSVLLCLSCLEKRLDRPLTLNDFTKVPLNALLLFGAKLGKNKK